MMRKKVTRIAKGLYELKTAVGGSQPGIYMIHDDRSDIQTSGRNKGKSLTVFFADEAHYRWFRTDVLMYINEGILVRVAN